MLASDSCWQRIVQRVGDHVLLTRIAASELAADSTSHPPDVMLVAYELKRPGAAAVRRWLSLLAAVIRNASAPVAVYAPLDADVGRSIPAWSRLGVSGIVFARIDDTDGAQFASLLQQLSARNVSSAIARGILCAGESWPDGLRETLATLFVAPWRFGGVEHVAMNAGMTRRTFERWCERAGIVSARAIVWTARLAWIYGELQVRRPRPGVIARSAGFGSTAQLRGALRAMLGCDDVMELEAWPRRVIERALLVALRRSAEAGSDRSGDFATPSDAPVAASSAAR